MALERYRPGWNRMWTKVGGGFHQRMSRDRAWVELRCPKRHLGMFRAENADGQNRFMQNHAHAHAWLAVVAVTAFLLQPIADHAPVGGSAAAQGTPVSVPDYPARPIVDDYPYRRGSAYQRQCGPFALWRIDSNRHLRAGTVENMLVSTGAYPLHSPGAADIDDAARRLGYRVDLTPSVGSVGVMERGYRGVSTRTGHAFYVARVDVARRRVLAEDYNGTRPLAYAARWVPWTYASAYVHLVGRPRPHSTFGGAS